jgi:hypothetical protein
VHLLPLQNPPLEARRTPVILEIGDYPKLIPMFRDLPVDCPILTERSKLMYSGLSSKRMRVLTADMRVRFAVVLCYCVPPIPW